ncbi:microtubule-associated protein 70-5 [Canna indica]|uniref:Microtubule-associated protein 70-5 n=1 Tax=Canna indica TaxID=4628 RepID=A0AAQ3JNS2_9LILI|nr:microtubule-associated protein 70-5 [Canna indica]
MGSLGDAGVKELFPGASDPVIIELNRLENNLLEKERELGLAKSEIKALKTTEILKDKAVTELSNEGKKMDEKIRANEKQLEQKNLEIKKLINEKKEALAAQFSAEATLRRVHASQKDEEHVPVEVLMAPLESDIRQYKSEIAMLQEDKKALERLTKSKEAALVETENALQSALEQAMNVEIVQNKNLELKKQIDISQEENKILEKAYRQKVVEVEKLTKTICELEESILASGVTANAIRDYQRQISGINEEKRMVERELARVKVSASRMAVVAANEWKDDNDKVIPVKQWLEERRFLQGEIQRLRDKVALAERTAKAESQLKEKLRLRLKTLEECVKHSSLQEKQSDIAERKRFGFASSRGSKKLCVASYADNNASVLQQPNLNSEGVDNARRTENLNLNPIKRNLLAPRSRSFNDSGKENAETNVRSQNGHLDDSIPGKKEVTHEVNDKMCGDIKSQNKSLEVVCEDMVSGFLYDRLQKEVINLREKHKDKNNLLNAKDDEIKLLQKKVDVLTKAVEVESKKTRNVMAREKEMLTKLEDNKHRIDISKRLVKQVDTSKNL